MTNNPSGRPAAPRITVFNPGGFLLALITLKESKGLVFLLWARVVKISFSTLRNILQGEGAATFENRAALARIIAMVGTPIEWATSIELPAIDQDITIADLRRLRSIAPNPFIQRWCDGRLSMIIGSVHHDEDIIVDEALVDDDLADDAAVSVSARRRREDFETS